MLLYQSLFAEPGVARSVRFVKGGAGALSDALGRVAARYGAEICTGVGVQKILLEDGCAAGVLLEDGRQFATRRVLSSLDPRRTFFGLVGAPDLDVSFVRDVRALRQRASVARLHLTLSGLPHFPAAAGGREALSGHIVVAADLDTLERAYDDAKYGQFSRRPLLDLVIPTLLDPQRAPAGAHLMTINMQYAPYSLAEGDWDSQRDNLLQTVLDTLETVAPGLRQLVTAASVRTPLDLERDLGLTGGDIYHGQMGLDQLLFMRPVAGYGRYATPISGLFLCGSGTHPGGGLTGAPGYNAARVILQEAQRS
jgi:phytoene dehydrogenase-like protein